MKKFPSPHEQFQGVFQLQKYHRQSSATPHIYIATRPTRFCGNPAETQTCEPTLCRTLYLPSTERIVTIYQFTKINHQPFLTRNLKKRNKTMEVVKIFESNNKEIFLGLIIYTLACLALSPFMHMKHTNRHRAYDQYTTTTMKTLSEDPASIPLKRSQPKITTSLQTTEGGVLHDAIGAPLSPGSTFHNLSKQIKPSHKNRTL